MKVLAILAVCAVLYFEQSQGFHLQSLKYRTRRDAEPTEDALTTKHNELTEFAVKKTVALAKSTVEGFQEVISKVLEQAKKDEVTGEDVDKFQKTLDGVNEILKSELDDEKSIEKLFELFGEVITSMETFDELEEPTAEQKALKQLFDDNNADLLAVKFYLEFMSLRYTLNEHVKEYIANLTDAEKEKESKLIDWYTTFKKAKGSDAMMDTTLAFFELIEENENE